MRNDMRRARHYRNRAISIRALGIEDANPETKMALLSMADEYDRLCIRLLERLSDEAIENAGSPFSDVTRTPAD